MFDALRADGYTLNMNVRVAGYDPRLTPDLAGFTVARRKASLLTARGAGASGYGRTSPAMAMSGWGKSCSRSRVGDFEVDVDGQMVPILKAPLHAENMAEDADDPVMSEYLARVRWLDTRSREEAFWEKGMFANQNVVAKLRQPFTLQRLTEVFKLDALRS